MSETPVTADDRLHDALIAFTGCIGEALDDICSYGLTIGESYVPFNPDPEDDCPEDDAICSQAWVRVETVVPTYKEDSFAGDDCVGVLALTLEVGVLRCLETPEEGEAPPASEMLVAGLQAMSDMRAIYCAAMACEVWDSIDSGTWSPTGPMGGQYGGIWTFTVEI